MLINEIIKCLDLPVLLEQTNFLPECFVISKSYCNFSVVVALLVTAKKRLQFRIRVQKRMRRVLEDKLEVFEDDIKNLEVRDYFEAPYYIISNGLYVKLIYE